MPTLPYASVDELRASFDRLCDSYRDVPFTELGLRLLSICNRDSVALLIDSTLQRMATEPAYRPGGCVLTHSVAHLRIDHVSPGQARPSQASTLPYATVAKLITGGPAYVYVLFPGESVLPGSEFLTTPQVFPYELGTESKPISLSAGCIRWFEGSNSAVILEVRSAPILPGWANVDLSTRRVNSLQGAGCQSTRHDLLESALISMLLGE